MASGMFDVEITISHAVELRKANPKKFDRLLEKFHFGLLDFPGVGSVGGPHVEATADEMKEWDRIKRESEVRNKQAIKEALASVLREPEIQKRILEGAREAFHA